MSGSSEPVRGASRAARPSRRATGAPKVSPTSSGVNASAQPSSALSSTGISTSSPRTRSGAAAAASSAALAPSDVPPITACVDLEVVEQRDRLAAEARHRVVRTSRAAGRSRRGRAGRGRAPGSRARRASRPAAGASCARTAGPGSSTTTRSPAAVLVVDEPVAVEVEIASRWVPWTGEPISPLARGISIPEERATEGRARWAPPSASQVTVNGESRESEVEARTLLVHWLRDELGPDRDAHRLRHHQLRRLHRPPQRRVGQELHRARGAGRRRARSRRSRASRRTAACIRSRTPSGRSTASSAASARPA